MHTLTPGVCRTAGFNHGAIGGLIPGSLITPESKHFHTPVSVIFQRCRCCVMHSRSANVMPHRGSAVRLLNCGVAPVGLSHFDGPLLGDLCVSSSKHGASVCFRRLSVSHLLTLTASNSAQMQSNAFTALALHSYTLAIEESFPPCRFLRRDRVWEWQWCHSLVIFFCFALLIKMWLRSLCFLLCLEWISRFSRVN